MTGITDNEVRFRMAGPEDAQALLAIYTPFIENTAVTFEYDVPSVPEFRNRIEEILREYPFIVAEVNSVIAGFAYAHTFRTREAYRHTAEVSIYILPEYHGRGIGRELYARLEDLLRLQNVFLLYACIVVPDAAAGFEPDAAPADMTEDVPDGSDPYVTDDSMKFHGHVGYRLNGRQRKCGYKFDRWYGTVWMEKEIRERVGKAEPFIPFPAVDRVNAGRILA